MAKKTEKSADEPKKSHGPLVKGQRLNTTGNNGRDDMEQIFQFMDTDPKESMAEFYKSGFGILAGLYKSDSFKRAFKKMNMKDKIKFSLDLARILNGGIDKIETGSGDNDGNLIIKFKGN
jgi:hypothetical protein